MLFADAIAGGLMKRSDLLRIASEQGWDLTDRQIENYIKEAREIFKEREIDNIDVKRRKRVKQLEHLAHVNYMKGDYQEVRHNIKAISDLEGLVQSRFRDEDDKGEGLKVVSRFADKWKKVSGEK